MNVDRVEIDLPHIEEGEGYIYLYDLLSHLTSSKLLFPHKVQILLRLSRESNKGRFTKSEIEALFPAYPAKTLDSILNSLIDGFWLEREEGTLSYTFTKSGLLFARFMPFMYKGDELDEMAFQLALSQMFDAAEKMQLGLLSLELMRDQAVHAIQRHILKIRSALISKNEERIVEAQQKMDVFLQDIDDFIKRVRQLNQEKRKLQKDISERDRNALTFLLSLKGSIIELFDERKKHMEQSTAIGGGFFSKADLDRFLNVHSFESLQELIEGIAFVPSSAKWIDEDDIVTALNVFLSRKKLLREKVFSPRVFGSNENTTSSWESSYVHQVESALREYFHSNERVDLSQFLLPMHSKEKVFMSLATLCFLDERRSISLGKNVKSFSLEVESECDKWEDQILRVLSKGEIVRRDKHERN
ncbi:hypothetical protein A616_28745 [Brevibacillus brevis X23]|nr:hypothetical protein A616_28745 [Brevibacillus brevis X23]